MSTLKAKITVDLLAGRANRDISIKYGCKSSVVSKVRRELGFARQQPTRYLCQRYKWEIRDLWVGAELGCPEIATRLGFPLDTVIHFLQTEGLT